MGEGPFKPKIVIMEIGSFIELDLRCTGEYFKGNNKIARLNSARAGIYHACRLLNCNSIHIPYYLCSTVKEFLIKHKIEINNYYINESFEPKNLNPQKNQAILIVNYFGILSNEKIKLLSSQFRNVIIDCSAAFYSEPLDNCYNIYSPRKFFGVPDGCYVIGNNANNLIEEYSQDFSSPTSSFLLKRIEFGLTPTYNERMENETRINKSDILKMSLLTKSLLGGIDYRVIKKKRLNNFHIVSDLFRSINMIDPLTSFDYSCTPMVYPLVIERRDLINKLKAMQLYVGRWWNHVLTEVPENTFEAWLSKFMLPIPIDQRYNKTDMLHIHDMIIKCLK